VTLCQFADGSSNLNAWCRKFFTFWAASSKPAASETL
jgi:hypothetical protein